MEALGPNVATIGITVDKSVAFKDQNLKSPRFVHKSYAPATLNCSKQTLNNQFYLNSFHGCRSWPKLGQIGPKWDKSGTF